MKTDIQNFLNQLIEAQAQMLAVLHKKQAILARPENDAMALISAEEEKSLVMMQNVLQRREELLTSARLQNFPCDSIEQLCNHFFSHNIEVQKMLSEAWHRTQQIRLVCYTNWTISRKSLIHISQILELLETQGQGKTTYQPQASNRPSRGHSVDRVA
jgi:hypothetical protein